MIQLSAHLGQNARNFPAANQDVVGPLDVRHDARLQGNRARQGGRRGDGQLGGACRGDVGAEQNGEPEALARWRKPHAAHPAAPFALGLRENHRAFPGFSTRQTGGDIVGGSRFLENVNLPANHPRQSQS